MGLRGQQDIWPSMAQESTSIHRICPSIGSYSELLMGCLVSSTFEVEDAVEKIVLQSLWL